MTTPDPRLVDEIFSGALELPPAERNAYIDARCGDDEALKQKIVDLLRASETPDGELANRVGEMRSRLFAQMLGEESADSENSEDLSGLRVGAWRLVERLARGGLATVYLASRADGQYDQRAAFKVLRRGLDTDDLVARFRAERQILSALDHPAIAGILDGGALADGRPYLVLEFVEGRPITEYCRDNELSVRARVRLMLEVLRALHYAHRHLIVHRDIKPTNILVSNEGHVTLLDFGIAKLLEPDALPGASTLTRTGMSLLTPAYCSPEQHAGERVTTASDIYQAGAVLYELLAGRRPRLVSDLAAATEALPETRVLEKRSGTDAMRGDLGAIVNKAMHEDPAQRYASADEMVADLERYLDGRPVIARPDTLAYRLGKFNRRRPWAIPVIAAAVLAIGGYVWTLKSYNEQLRVEQRRAAAAQAFLVDILSSPDPFRPADPDRGRDITVVEALDLGADRLDADLDDDPELKASVLASIARVYASLDQHERAITMREEALALERYIHGDVSEPVLDSSRMLAGQYLALSDLDKAADYAGRQLESARLLYQDDDPALGAAEALAADVAFAAGDFETAEALAASAVERLRGAPGKYRDTLINALTTLAGRRQYEDPEQTFELIAEARQLAQARYGESSLPVARVRSRAAAIYSNLGDYERAKAEFHAAIPVYEAHLGDGHRETLSTINNLAVVHFRTGEYERAEDVYRELLGRFQSKYGRKHRQVADVYQNLAASLTRQGRYTESIPMHREAYEIYTEILPENHRVSAMPLLSKAYAEINTNRYADAEETGRRAQEILEGGAEGTFLIGIARCLVGLALEGQGEQEQGSAMVEEAHGLLTGSIVPDTYREFCRVPQR